MLSEQPDFRSSYRYFGWGYPLELTDRVEIEAGFLFGTLYMENTSVLVDDPDSVFEESEFAASLYGRVSLNLTSRISCAFDARHTSVYFFKRTAFTDLSLGISYQFQTPDWLIEVLK